MKMQTVLAEEVTQGPFGNPSMSIPTPGIVELRKNPVVDEARETTSAILSGKGVMQTAIDASDLTAYGVGSMIARLVEKRIADSADDIYAELNDVFSAKNLGGAKALRFSRRTVLSALLRAGLINTTEPLRNLKPAGTNPSAQAIFDVVEETLGIGTEDLVGTKRSRNVVHARFVTIWVMRHICGHSLTAIGQQMGNRDHTSIINGLNRLGQKREQDLGCLYETRNICDRADLSGIAAHHAILVKQAELRRVH